MCIISFLGHCKGLNHFWPDVKRSLIPHSDQMRELHFSLCVSGSMLELICYAGSFQATSVRSQEQTLILQGFQIKDVHTYCAAASRWVIFSCVLRLWEVKCHYFAEKCIRVKKHRQLSLRHLAAVFLYCTKCHCARLIFHVFISGCGFPHF